MASMYQALKKNWRLFLSSPPGRRFQDFHDRREAKRAKTHARRTNLLLLGGIAIAILGLVLLPLPGPGSIVLVGGLMLTAAESLTMARMLDWMDKKRAKLVAAVRRTARRWGPLRCFLLGVVVGALALAAGMALWRWLS